MIEALKVIGWSLVIIAAFYPFEVLISAEKNQKISRKLQNLSYMPLIILFIYLIQPYVNSVASDILKVGSIFTYVFNPSNDGVQLIIFSLFFALIWDTWQYWVHRLQHTNKILWSTHAFHHSEIALNATTHSRTHAFSHILFLILYIPLLLILGSLSPHWIVALLMFRFWGYFNHANIRLNLGLLTPVISGPQWHRIHHSILPEHQDKNFATFFPFLDILFGTYFRPGPNEYPETGLASGKQVKFIKDATIQPVLDWIQMFSNWQVRRKASTSSTKKKSRKSRNS